MKFKDDLISRAQAIDALKECYCGGEDSCGEPWIYEDHAIKAIEQLPPAQPEQHGTNLAEVGTDAISRKALINKFEQWQKQDGYDNEEWNLLVDVITEIKNMPPATDIYVGTKDGTDCISRQAAIDAIDECHCGGEDSCGEPWIYKENAVESIQMIEPIPSAEPEPCEDAVSRQTLKDGFTEMCNLICPYTKKQQHVMCGSCLMGTAFDVLEATPSVTPKQRTGKWIYTGGYRTWYAREYRCSKCGDTMLGEANFCPNCGRYNGGEQDDKCRQV